MRLGGLPMVSTRVAYEVFVRMTATEWRVYLRARCSLELRQ